MENNLNTLEATLQGLHLENNNLKDQIDKVEEDKIFLQSLLVEAAAEIERLERIVKERNLDIDFLIGDDHNRYEALNILRYDRVLEWYISNGFVEGDDDE